MMNNRGEIQQFKQAVLDDFPKLGEGDSFTFECHSKLECFNKCCADVTIVLSPYDILRMKNALGLGSEEFLKRYTFVPFSREQRLPVAVLRLNDDDRKTCPFVTEEGCSIYENRPWACRMYPLGMGSPKDASVQGETFYFLIKEKPCGGFEENRSQTIREWLEDQGVVEYNGWGEFFKEISLHDFFVQGSTLDPQRMEMLYMACYDLDRFRRFVFESSFLKSFEVPREELDKIKNDDVEMMLFAFKWLKFSMFGESGMTIRKKARQKWEKKLSQS